jgi:hypothetical protein
MNPNKQVLYAKTNLGKSRRFGDNAICGKWQNRIQRSVDIRPYLHWRKSKKCIHITWKVRSWTCSLGYSSIRRKGVKMSKDWDRNRPTLLKAKFIKSAAPYWTEYWDVEVESEEPSTFSQIHSMSPNLIIWVWAALLNVNKTSVEMYWHQIWLNQNEKTHLKLHFCKIPSAFWRMMLSVLSVFSAEKSNFIRSWWWNKYCDKFEVKQHDHEQLQSSQKLWTSRPTEYDAITLRNLLIPSLSRMYSESIDELMKSEFKDLAETPRQNKMSCWINDFNTVILSESGSNEKIEKSKINQFKS